MGSYSLFSFNARINADASMAVVAEPITRAPSTLIRASQFGHCLVFCSLLVRSKRPQRLHMITLYILGAILTKVFSLEDAKLFCLRLLIK